MRGATHSVFDALAGASQAARPDARRLLLLGFAPDAVVIDPLQRVHYVGTDMALAQSSPLLDGGTGAELWTRFFPPERFPRGFAAPECFQPSCLCRAASRRISF